MKSTGVSAAITAAALLVAPVYAATPVQNGGFMSTPTAEPTGLRALTKIGCFKSAEPMINKGPYIYQTPGNCQKICYNLEADAMALANGTDCWCGNKLPSLDSKVDDALCSTKCAGWPSDTCGGAKVWNVYETGFTLNKVPYFDQAVESPSASASISASAVPKKEGGGSNTVGIVVGVIVGIIALAAAAGGGFLYLRRKQQRELEEFKRQTDTQSFAKVEENRPSMWAPDTRMENGAGRRMSSGSIDDNADYSRKILQVRNPDGF